MSFGFLLKSEEDFEELSATLNTSLLEDKPYQIFHKGTNDDLFVSFSESTGTTKNKVNVNPNGNGIERNSDSIISF